MRTPVWRGRAAGLAVGVLLLAAPAVSSPAAAAAPAAAGNGWTRVVTPHTSGQDETLSGVDVVGGDVWAVGQRRYTVGGAYETRTLAQRFDGRRFVDVPTPDHESAPAANGLSAVSGAAADDVWSVGTWYDENSRSHPLVEHWDGTTWSFSAAPDLGPSSSYLSGVAALTPEDVWAVGAAQPTGGFYLQPATMHWNGGQWVQVPFPQPGGCTGHSQLTGVTAVAGSGVWAVGYCSGPSQGYVGRWDGSRWRLVAGAGSGVVPPSSTLLGIGARGPADVWAVGYVQPPGGSAITSLTVHWNGRAWSVVGNDAQAALQAVAVTAGHRAWAVGAGSSPQPPFAGPFAMRHGAATGWVAAPPGTPYGSLLAAATGADGTVWAVGRTFAASDGAGTGYAVRRH